MSVASSHLVTDPPTNDTDLQPRWDEFSLGLSISSAATSRCLTCGYLSWPPQTVSCVKITDCSLLDDGSSVQRRSNKFVRAKCNALMARYHRSLRSSASSYSIDVSTLISASQCFCYSTNVTSRTTTNGSPSVTCAYNYCGRATAQQLQLTVE